MGTISTEVIFFFDDSGVLHKKEPSNCFVYAGYVFVGRERMEIAKRKYIHANKELKKATGLTGELKASRLRPMQRRSLFNCVREFESISLVVDISRVYDSILSNKKARCRYKDYVLKIGVKKKIEELISRNIIDPNADLQISVYIDEQLTATNGYYDLRDSIKEELQYGISNFDYGIIHPNVINADVQVSIMYCNSEKDYLIQASDILANRIWSSYSRNKPNLRVIDKHLFLTFP